MFMQQVTITVLYYTCAVDVTMLVALSAITPKQTSPTEKNTKKSLQFLDYRVSHPDEILTY